jgi:hypothetical protein
MASLFFITGLPRSRTAWLARFMSAGTVACIHDGIMGCRSGQELVEKVSKLPGTSVGDSDSGLSLFWPELVTTRAKWLVVRRDPAESLRSFLAMEPYPGIGPIPPLAAAETIGRMSEGLDRIEDLFKPMVVKFEALDDEQTMRRIWHHLTDDFNTFPAWHWEEMRHMRVTIRPETYNVFGRN